MADWLSALNSDKCCQGLWPFDGRRTRRTTWLRQGRATQSSGYKCNLSAGGATERSDCQLQWPQSGYLIECPDAGTQRQDADEHKDKYSSLEKQRRVLSLFTTQQVDTRWPRAVEIKGNTVYIKRSLIYGFALQVFGPKLLWSSKTLESLWSIFPLDAKKYVRQFISAKLSPTFVPA